ncbi:MAG: hypothetical protein RLZZ312_1493 [Bacteroidota bacterium]|jgi:hypothetical protein
MVFEKVNLQKKLLVERNKFVSENDLLLEIKALFDRDENDRNIIKSKLKSESSTKHNDFDFDLFETDNIFHLQQIKNICVDYRLRFLDSSLFKNEIPEEAISKIKNLETTHNSDLGGFKIMAPSKLFHLKNYDDPLLFVPIGNDYFYLIHKWGGELNPFRKLAVRPFRNLSSFFALLLVISMLIAFITPYDILGRVSPDIFRILSFLFVFKSLAGIALYYCFWQGKNFNEAIWNSKYYN